MIRDGDDSRRVGSLRAVEAHTLAGDDEIVFSGAGTRASFVLAGALLFSDTRGGYLRLLPGEILVLTSTSPHRLASASKKATARIVTLVFDAEQAIDTYARYISDDDKSGTLHKVASMEGSATAARLAAPADVYWSTLEKWDTLIHTMMAGHAAVVRVFSGTLAVNDERLGQGATAVIEDTSDVRLSGVERCEFILIDAVGKTARLAK